MSSIPIPKVFDQSDFVQFEGPSSFFNAMIVAPMVVQIAEEEELGWLGLTDRQHKDLIKQAKLWRDERVKFHANAAHLKPNNESGYITISISIHQLYMNYVQPIITSLVPKNTTKRSPAKRQREVDEEKGDLVLEICKSFAPSEEVPIGGDEQWRSVATNGN